VYNQFVDIITSFSISVSIMLSFAFSIPNLPLPLLPSTRDQASLRSVDLKNKWKWKIQMKEKYKKMRNDINELVTRNFGAIGY